MTNDPLLAWLTQSRVTFGSMQDSILCGIIVGLIVGLAWANFKRVERKRNKK